MYLLFSKTAVNLQYAILLAEDDDDLLKKFRDYILISDIDDKIKLIEYKENDIMFSLIDADNNFYYKKLDNQSENLKKLYVLEFIEESNYGKKLYIKYANDIIDILEIAKYIVISKSEYVDYDDINNMKYQLIKNGYYQIKNGRTYECDMFLWKLNL
jgi:hypothetical protein